MHARGVDVGLEDRPDFVLAGNEPVGLRSDRRQLLRDGETLRRDLFYPERLVCLEAVKDIDGLKPENLYQAITTVKGEFWSDFEQAGGGRLDLLAANNHLTLAECRDQLAAETGVRVSPWIIGRALRRLDWT